MEPKQVIVVRKDLKMRKGKIAAQVAHASMKVILDKAVRVATWHTDGLVGIEFRIPTTNEDPLYHWIYGLFTKIVVSCNSEEEELLDLKEKADSENIINALIQDSGKTEFHGVPTYTALAIGPDIPEKIDKITSHLSLL